MSLYRLVYYSENRIRTDDSDFAVEIEKILSTSRRNNARAGLSGALMFSEGYFGQVLEGPQSAIEATFERLQRDQRHSDVVLLEFTPVSARIFQSWTMAYVGNQSGLFSAFEEAPNMADHRDLGQAVLSKLRELVESASVFPLS